jgi:hypothetical protein
MTMPGYDDFYLPLRRLEEGGGWSRHPVVHIRGVSLFTLIPILMSDFKSDSMPSALPISMDNMSNNLDS